MSSSSPAPAMFGGLLDYGLRTLDLWLIFYYRGNESLHDFVFDVGSKL
jgi:hypothetical protein